MRSEKPITLAAAAVHRNSLRKEHTDSCNIIPNSNHRTASHFASTLDRGRISLSRFTEFNVQFHVMTTNLDLNSSPLTRRTKKCGCPLPLNYEPHRLSVRSRRGKHYSQTTGNKRLKLFCSRFSEKYTDHRTLKSTKSAIVSEIVSLIHSSCNGQEGFVKYMNGRWWKCTESHARQQVTAALRDCHPDKYPSSITSKLEKRRKCREARQIELALADEPEHSGEGGLASPVVSENEEDLSLNSASRQILGSSDDDSSSILTYPDLCEDFDFARLRVNHLDSSGCM